MIPAEVLSQDPTDTFWLKKLRDYRAAENPIIKSTLQPTTAPHHDLTFSFGVMRLSDGVLPQTQAVNTSPSLDVHHASPIAPLRQRDSAALNDFFECDHIQEIALDIHRYLARTYPEPCWEDEPYEFLNGYI